MKRVLMLSVLSVILIGLAGRALLYWYGLTVTSWWRSPWKNYEVGGKWLSLHLIGWAYDVIPVNQSIHAVRSVWPFRWLPESDHIHLQIL